ncbi:hypothetical protein NE562_12985 [Butyricicoccus faecihominis]|uniref:hypothetical protein n=1 Tax=Butyricicoccus faecihominis TaxID=1712515 RepID=UPI0024793B21|nr:hypothetical protein [Butyricicoccus faecihominis]MCQ5130581.1 hypothetical protein [Butyricicoccus faecihominis]
MKKHRLFAFLSIVCLLLAALPVFARADMGPKPQITVRVVNPPSEPYYLDLLIPVEEAGDCDNLTWNGLNELDGSLVDALHSLEKGTFSLALLSGTVGPLTGSLIPENNTSIFGYHSVPKSFSIAVACADGTIKQTPLVKRTAFQQVFTYDYSANTVTAQSAVRAYVRQFAYTCSMTLFFEGGVLLLFFGLSAGRRTWLIFLLTNVGTQIFLTLTWGPMVISGDFSQVDAFLAPWPLLLLEAAIWIFEALIYKKFFRVGSVRRRVTYAIMANAVSLFVTIFSVSDLMRFANR